MIVNDDLIQILLTLPPRMSAEFEGLEKRRPPEWFAAADPEGQPLGSGGGTAHLLGEAWTRMGGELTFPEWLHRSRKLVLHGGGQSRRLPAYAPMGKPLLPIPVFRWSRGQRLDQTLLDLQLPSYRRVLNHAPSNFVAMVASGDVLLRLPAELPPFPNVDVLGLGMWVPPETAKEFGVFFTSRQKPGEVALFLQKPLAARIRELAHGYLCLVDTGIWLLSERAARLLMERCGWNWTQQRFAGTGPRSYEFYSEFCLALGTTPGVADEQVNALSCAVAPLSDAQFYHFGTTAQMVESVAALQNLVLDETRLSRAAARYRSDQVTQNSRVDVTLRRDDNRALWIENCRLPTGWLLASEHVLTGVPENDWNIRLPQGVCLDFVPVGETGCCIRFYGFHDGFRGALGHSDTRWLGLPVSTWFAERGLNLADCGLDPRADIQSSPLFPIIEPVRIESAFIQWLFSCPADDNRRLGALWRESPRLSALQLTERINLARLYAQRVRFRNACLPAMFKNFRSSVFFRLDLEATARAFAVEQLKTPELFLNAHDHALDRVRAQIFRSALLRNQGDPEWQRFEGDAFSLLRQAIIHEASLAPCSPMCNVKEDQIIWARSPVRLDLAGGWTDTPPYCLEHGGKVLNVAVDLNGQPPIQVFAKLSDRPQIVLRSIDLGCEERVHSYAELEACAQPDSPFGLAKAALALAGFVPRFHAGPNGESLEAQLRRFGGGIELSLLSAVPKGSGLGTSSILAATVLAALSELCALGWARDVLFQRTLALEQMLTTGGGWQDQAGALFRGIKLIETSPGLAQKPAVRWLPGHLFEHEYANRSLLLYYTGVTRLAKNILAEIVRGIFLNSRSHLDIIAEIGANAEFASGAIQKCDYDLLATAIRNSWLLNQRLDSGTNPPAVQNILQAVGDRLCAAKLLGAGGGGFLLLLAKSEDAAAKIRSILTANPPNARARFVEFSLSQTGLQVTRS